MSAASGLCIPGPIGAVDMVSPSGASSRGGWWCSHRLAGVEGSPVLEMKSC